MLARDLFPTRSMDGLFERLEPFFGGEFLPRAFRREAGTEWQPSADIVETQDEFLVKAALPEVRKEDVRIEVVDGRLRIRGERRFEVDERNETVHRVESFYGRFERTFGLPERVNPQKITATLAEGVLTVHIPKVVAELPRPLEVPVR